MSDTPRVDAICKTRNCGYWGIPYQFACELERELGQVRLLMSKAHEVSVTIDQRYNARVRELEVRNADLVQLISQFDAAIRRIAAELTGKACGGVDTGDEINPETGEPYGHGGHTGWLLAEEAKNLKARLMKFQIEWQPIETAPKDGTHFLASEMKKYPSYGGCYCARWDSTFSMFETIPGRNPVQPTHWMPLPEPPTE